jgi:nucleoside-diphosphate-sugar epimerase
LQLLKNRRVVLLNDGNGVCNPVFVDDVIDGMLRAATRAEAVGQKFLLSGPEAVTWRDFFGAYETMLGFKSTLSMTGEEALTELEQQRKARSTWRQLRQAIRSPRLHQRLRKLPIVAKMVSPHFWERLGKPTPEENEKPLWIPDPSLFGLFQGRTRVCIDKARDQLGYAPRYDLARGMALTQKWVEWANLIEHK